MTDVKTLVSAKELVKRNKASFPNGSVSYRRARNELLAEEIELRRQIWRVGEMRRALPSGGEVTADYRFEGLDGELTLAELFGNKDTLILYSMMYGPEREKGCPMCSALLDSWDGVAPHKDMADPGQHPGPAPEWNPLWILLDLTPDGRGENWYPKLDD